MNGDVRITVSWGVCFYGSCLEARFIVNLSNNTQLNYLEEAAILPEKEPVHVMHIMSEFGGGISSFIMNKAESLAGSNVVFDVVTFEEPSERFRQAIEGTGGQVYQVPNPVKKSLPQCLRQTNQIMKSKPKDTIIYCHYGMDLALLFYLLAKWNRLEFIIHAHTADPAGNNNFRRRLNTWMSDRQASCGLGATENIFGEASAREGSVVHIPNSIRVENFLQPSKAAATSKKLEVYGPENEGKFMIGQIGRFHVVKNHGFSLDIIEQLTKQANFAFQWVFIGEGELEEQVKQQVKDRGLENYVKFLGRREDVAELYQTLDVIVLPSHFEGLSTVAIEAQASGVVSLLSDVQTRETDLGLKLVEFLPIEEASIWADAIMAHYHQPVTVTPEERLAQFAAKKFTNPASAELYEAFLRGEVKEYQI